MKRNRLIYFSLIIVVIILGLCSRKFTEYLPYIIAKYAGDILWAFMVYLGFGLIFYSSSTKLIFFISLLFSYSIEISQLYHGVLIDRIRDTIIGKLILGQGFLWSDLICYFVGIIFGVLIDNLYNYKRKNNSILEKIWK